jgi:hypothetical protein
MSHSQIATERPLIKQVTEFSEKASRFRGSAYAASPDRMRFNRVGPASPARRATATANQTVIGVPSTSMGFCVNCHREKESRTTV